MDISQNFKEFLQSANSHNVRYLVVGGYAVSYYGHPSYTGDLDFWYCPDSESAKKLMQALVDFGFGSLGLSEKDFTEPDQVIQLGYEPERIDILTGVSGLDFETCWKDRKIVEWDGMELNFISLRDLRINKSATGRKIDLDDLDKLPNA